MEKIREAVSGIVEYQGQILIGKKTSQAHFLKDAWHLPGGHIEEGESEEEALVRELQEETNITVQILEFLDESFSPDKTTHIQWYLCKPLTHALKAGDDLVAVKYVPKKEIQRLCDSRAVSLWPPKVIRYLTF